MPTDYCSIDLHEEIGTSETDGHLEVESRGIAVTTIVHYQTGY